MRKQAWSWGLAAGLAVAGMADASAEPLLALTSGNVLVRLDSATPGSFTGVVPVTGLAAGESLVGIDVRPASQQLYGLGVTAAGIARLYVLNPNTGVASLVGTLASDPADPTSPYTLLSGTRIGMDFNPVPDRLRVVTDSGLNLRINPNTALVISDTNLNGAATGVGAAAYINSYAGATLTVLYDLDAVSDTLLVQNPPNNGTLALVGALGVNATDAIGFDILASGGVNTAFATLQAGGVTGLYTINLDTGAATLVGNLASSPTVLEIALLAPDLLYANGFE